MKNIISNPPLDMPKLSGLGYTYFHKMLEFKDKIAQTDGVTGEKETYDFLLQKSVRTAITMRSKGIKPKDVVTICTLNHLNCFVPYYASLFLGAIPANLDPALSLSDTVHLLKQVRPKIIFAGPEGVKLMEDAVRETQLDSTIVVFGNTPHHVQFSEFLLPSPEEKHFVPFEVENLKETAVIVFSSGTTGLPKGICLTHYGLLGHMYHNTSSATDLVLLITVNLYWIASTTVTVSVIVNGFNRLIYPKFEANKIWELIKDYKVNIMSLNPHQIVQVCKNGRPSNADTSSLKFFFLSGGPMSTEQILHVRNCFPGVLAINTYGQTEQNGRTLGFRPQINPNDFKLLTEKPNSVGKPLPGYSYKIVNPETEEILGPNQEGELRIKTEFQMNGYYNMDASDVWDSEGFMKTGDIAYYDEDQCFFIVDRIKDLLKYNCWHISPAKLENIFRTHPAVQDVLVIGIPHPVDGDHLMGVVVLKESHIGKVTAEELRGYVDERVDENKKLRAGVKIVESLPVTITDKLSRRKLKQLVLQGKL